MRFFSIMFYGGNMSSPAQLMAKMGQASAFFARHRATQTKMVQLRGRQYPVMVEGTGQIPCYGFGTGGLLQKTLSDKFKAQYQTYTSDTYWINSGKLEHPERLTMDDLVDDVLATVQQLGLKEYVLLGFSCFGIVAMEAAKRRPQGLLGILAVAAPPRWDDAGIARAQAHFEADATPERKKNHLARRAHFEKVKQPGESIVSVNNYIADAAKYFHDYEVSDETIRELWRGIEAEDGMMNRFFGEILPNYSLAEGLDKVDVPVAVITGRHDYDSSADQLWLDYPKPRLYTAIDCGDTGHWPHYENAEFFDAAVAKWTQEVLLKQRSQQQQDKKPDEQPKAAATTTAPLLKK
jgi:pimeloyl-ACP methyl ester carboxylesterase